MELPVCSEIGVVRSTKSTPDEARRFTIDGRSTGSLAIICRVDGEESEVCCEQRRGERCRKLGDLSGLEFCGAVSWA
jgi:hypothetical protein